MPVSLEVTMPKRLVAESWLSSVMVKATWKLVSALVGSLLSIVKVPLNAVRERVTRWSISMRTWAQTSPPVVVGGLSVCADPI